jgi:hypothetical protein
VMRKAEAQKIRLLMRWTRRFSFKLLRTAAFAGVFLWAVPMARAQDVVVDTFDSADEVLQWSRWWGSADQTYEFDPSTDANSNPNSGSLKATVVFDVTAHVGDNQFAVVGAFPDNATLDGTIFTNLVFDVKWDTNSPTRAPGDFGALEFGFRASDYSQIWLTPASPMTVPIVTTNNGWLHVVGPIDPTAKGLSQVTGVVLKMWAPDQTGTATFWVDNVKLIANTNVVLAAPTLSMQRAEPGLQIFASHAGAPTQRQDIRTVSPEYSWVGAGQPVTYSLTITNYPDTNHAGFQTQIFLVPGDAVPKSETSPDWNEPNVVFLDIQNNSSGGAYATFRYKTNLPNGNSMLYTDSSSTNGPVGALASINTSQIAGTWSLTFANDTSVTLSGPGGVSTNFDLPPEAAADFAGPLYAYFGIQPNNVASINQSARLSAVQITGVGTPIDENFAGVTNDTQTIPDLDPAIWERAAEDAAGVVLVPPDAAFWLNWTVPAAGYVLQMSPDLTPDSWTDVAAPATQIGNQMSAVVRSTDLPQGASAFFRLVKPPAPPQGPQGQ